ncbi:hypothetical protein [uncultured Oxalicibacterium sp.]|uniref:hypothetical protein n=1 Tax=uncultured Oxalicibacterium sp. TaxID=1168540 RepID=UPI0025E07F39|nr:hypothetical protein [uncultured Oxalicibacterium sp.]
MHASHYRSHLIDRLRHRLDRQSYPRLQMSLLVIVTGGMGFLASSLLLLAGMQTMWSRYLLALAIAYLFFLGLLWLWLRTRADDYTHADLIPTPNFAHSTPCAQADFTGKGGTFDGGGASDNFDHSYTSTMISVSDHGVLPHDDMGVTEGVDTIGSADELAFPILALVFVGGLLVSAFLLIHAAPTLFAELLLDGVLAASLYRRLRKMDTRHWLETAVRRTAGPFAIVAAMLVLAGWLAQVYAPHAITLSQAVFGH